MPVYSQSQLNKHLKTELNKWKLRIRINKSEDTTPLKCTRQSVYSIQVYWSGNLTLLFTEIANLSAIRLACSNNNVNNHHILIKFDSEVITLSTPVVSGLNTQTTLDSFSFIFFSSGFKVEKQGLLCVCATSFSANKQYHSDYSFTR